MQIGVEEAEFDSQYQNQNIRGRQEPKKDNSVLFTFATFCALLDVTLIIA